MKSLFGILQKQQKAKRDTIFRQNGTTFGYNRNFGEVMNKSRQTASTVMRTQANFIQKEVTGSPAVKIIKHVVTQVAPKKLTMTFLKMKIHMQTLIGNFFGVRFASLEANVEKLERVKSDLNRERGFHRTMRQTMQTPRQDEKVKDQYIDQTVTVDTTVEESGTQDQMAEQTEALAQEDESAPSTRQQKLDSLLQSSTASAAKLRQQQAQSQTSASPEIVEQNRQASHETVESYDSDSERDSEEKFNLSTQQQSDTFGGQVQLYGDKLRTGVARVAGNIQAAVQATFDRIRGIYQKAKARFSRAIPRTKRQARDIFGEAVEKAKQLSSIESLKGVIKELGERVRNREVLKYFSSRTEFLKLVEPLTKRYHELVRKMTGKNAAAQQKPESPLWLDLTGMTKAEIQQKAAQEMRFIMVNSGFSSNKAKDAVNQANSKGAMEGNGNSFYNTAMREMEYFSDYVTGGFYQQSKLRRHIQKLTDGKSSVDDDAAEEDRSAWSDFFQSNKQRKSKKQTEWEDDSQSDPRPKIYLALFSVVVGFGMLESFMLKVKKMRLEKEATSPPEAGVAPAAESGLTLAIDNSNNPNMVQARIQVMSLEIEKLKLELELQKMQQSSKSDRGEESPDER